MLPAASNVPADAESRQISHQRCDHHFHLLSSANVVLVLPTNTEHGPCPADLRK